MEAQADAQAIQVVMWPRYVTLSCDSIGQIFLFSPVLASHHTRTLWQNLSIILVILLEARLQVPLELILFW